MEYWTIMWITALGGMFDGESSYVVYPSLDTCRAALTVVSDTLPYDHQIACVVTDTPSKSLRPKPRPEGWGG